MRYYLFLFALFTSLGNYAQQKEIDWTEVDSLYREDQFYCSFSYNSLQKTPPNINQDKISFGMRFGFLRDIPINKSRTVSIAAGLGYSFGVYNQNLGIFNENGDNVYTALDNYSINKLSIHYAELPIEFRWRNSTPENNKFWRIYSGIKVGYMFYDQYKLVSYSTNSKMSNNSDLENLQYGLTLAVGWNTWNFYTYYGLNPLFKSSAKIDNQPIEMRMVNFGMMFYIL